MQFSLRSKKAPKAAMAGTTASSARLAKKNKKGSELGSLKEYNEFALEGFFTSPGVDPDVYQKEDNDLQSFELITPGFSGADRFPDEAQFLAMAKSDDDAYKYGFADDFVENTRGSHAGSAYRLFQHIPYTRLRGEDVDWSQDSKEELKALGTVLNDEGVLFDVEEDGFAGNPAPVVVLDTAGVIEQFERLRKPSKYQRPLKCQSFLGQRSPSLEPCSGELTMSGKAALNPSTESGIGQTNNESKIRETTLVWNKYKPYKMPNRVLDPVICNARDVTFWDDATRDFFVEYFDGTRSLAMGQILPPKSVPNRQLHVDTDVDSPSLAESSLLSRRFTTWRAKQADVYQCHSEEETDDVILLDGALFRQDSDDEFLSFEDDTDSGLFTWYDDLDSEDDEEDGANIGHRGGKITVFDSNTNQPIEYLAFSQLLREGQEASNLNNREADLDNVAIQDMDEFHLARSTNDYLAVPQQPTAGGYRGRPKLNLVTRLETIPEENESDDTSSSSSSHFGGRRHFVAPLPIRRPDFIDEDDMRSPTPSGQPTEEELLIGDNWPAADTVISGSLDPLTADPTVEVAQGPAIPSIMVEDFDKYNIPQTIDAALLFPTREPKYNIQFDAVVQKIEDLEKDIIQFIEYILNNHESDSSYNLTQTLDDANWALGLLSQTSPSSLVVVHLQTAIQLLQDRYYHQKLDPIWTTMFTPNGEGTLNFDPEEKDLFLEIKDLIAECPSFEMDSDGVQNAQVKFTLWTTHLEPADPFDPDYEMLTYAHKASTKLLEHLKQVACDIEQMTITYVEQIRNGNDLYLEEMRKEITKATAPQAPSGLGGMTLGEASRKVWALYYASRLPGRCRLQRRKAPKQLRKWKTILAGWKSSLRKSSITSLQADNSYHATDRFWKTASKCMGMIEAAHNEVCSGPNSKAPTQKYVEMEGLMWSLWISAMSQSLCAMEDFAEKLHPSFLPTANDVLLDSLSWWESKVYQATRRIQATH